MRLFGEEVFPVCAPGLQGIGGQPLHAPEDLRYHVLLEQEDAEQCPASVFLEHVAGSDGAASHEAGRNAAFRPA